MALDKENEMIKKAIKKPFVEFNYAHLRVTIGRDKGYIDE